MLPRAFSLCLAPPDELGFLFEPIGPGTRALAALDGRRRDPRHGAARERLRPRRRATAPRRRRDRDRAAPVPLRASRRPAGASRLPQRAPRRGGGARAERRGRARPDARDRRAARPSRATSSRAAPSRCSMRSRRSSRAPSSPARRRWRAGTGRATAASSRGTAATSASAWKGPCSPPRVRRPMSVPILNASGCLDALAAPDVARSLDAFVTKTITPLPREGNPPVRIAETEHGMLNSIGLQGPGIDAFVADHLPRLAEIVAAALGLGRRLLRRRLRRCAASASTATSESPRSSSTSRARTSRRRPRRPRSSSPPRARPRACRSTRSSRLRSGTSPRRRAPSSTPARTGSRSSTRSAASRSIRSTLRPNLARGAGGYSGPALRPIALACVHACASAVDVPIVGMGGVATGRDALELVAVGASAVALGHGRCSRTPARPVASARSSTAEAAARGFATPRDAPRRCQIRKIPWKSPRNSTA